MDGGALNSVAASAPAPLARIFSILCGAAVCGLPATGVYWSVRLGLADFHARRASASLETLQRAVRLAPGNSRYLARMAEFEVDRGLDPAATLALAAQANPLSSEIWTSRALNAEQKLDYSSAERYLLRAAAIDKQFQPKWNLLSYYFRRNDRAAFWKSVRPALEMAPENMAAIFWLCWMMDPDPDWVLANAIPNRAPALAQYVGFLIANKHLDAAGKAAEKLSRIATKSEMPDLLYYCDHRIVAGQARLALPVWNSLAGRGIIAQNQVDPERGPWLVNGDFREDPLNLGFDWRVQPREGVSTRRTGRGFHIELSGNQPESCPLLLQFIVLQPGRKYKLSNDYAWHGARPPDGLKWRLLDFHNRVIPLDDAVPLHEGAGATSATFMTPADVDSGQLWFVYERAPGTVRIEGELDLSKVALQRLP